MTTQNAFYTEVTAVKKSVNAQGFQEISRASRRIPAGRGQKRTNCIPLKLNQHHKWEYGDFLKVQGCRLNVVPSFPSLSAMPSAASSSRIWSERAKFLLARAVFLMSMSRFTTAWSFSVLSVDLASCSNP